jgi:hypothetical protein
MLSQPHLIYRLRRLNARRLLAGAHEARRRQRPKEARTIRPKEATSHWTYDCNPKIVFYIYGPTPTFGCMHPPTDRPKAFSPIHRANSSSRVMFINSGMALHTSDGLRHQNGPKKNPISLAPDLTRAIDTVPSFVQRDVA